MKGGPASDSDEVVNMSVSCHISTSHHTTLPKLVPKQAAETTVDRLEEAISNPGAVKINVKGAFIVENDSSPSEYLPEGGGLLRTKGYTFATSYERSQQDRAQEHSHCQQLWEGL